MLQTSPDLLTLTVSFSDPEGVVDQFLNFLTLSLGVDQFVECEVQNIIENDFIRLHKQFLGQLNGSKLMIQFYLIEKIPEVNKVDMDLVVILSSFYIDKNNEQDIAFKLHFEQIEYDQEQYGFQFVNSHVIPQVLDHTKSYDTLTFKLRKNLSISQRDKLFQQAKNHQDNSKSFLFEWFETMLVNIIKQNFKLTFIQHLKHQRMIPITISPKKMLQDVSRIILKEVISKDEISTRILSRIKDELQQNQQNNEQLIENINTESCLVLGNICELIIELMKKNQESSKIELKQTIKLQLIRDLADINLPDCLSERQDQYREAILSITNIIIEKIYQLIDETTTAIIQEEMNCLDFHTIMGDFIETFMCRITIELKEFALVHCHSTYKFYIKLKETFSTILQDINLFLFKTSCLANTQMEELNKVLTEYHSLANVRTFQILQTETSQIIVDQAINSLKTDSFFFRPEFYLLEFQLTTQAIRQFYTYSNERMGMYTLTTKTKNFANAMTIIGFENLPNESLTILEEPNKLWFQSMHKVSKSYDTLLDCNITQKLLQNSSYLLTLPILNMKNQFTVSAYQDIYNSKTGRIALSIQLENLNGKQLPCLILEIDHQNFTLVLHTSNILSDNWESKSKITYIENSHFDQFLEDQKKNFNHYNSKFGQEDVLDYSQRRFSSIGISSSLIKFSEDKDDLIKYKNYLQKKRVLRPSGTVSGGSRIGATSALAGGTIGAGIGCLIIDSLDPNIGWSEKLKRAGFTTVSTGLMGAAMRIPVVGVLISQALMVFAMKKVIGNKVLSNTEKAKNATHIGVQSGVGVGLAIAGQILIPVPVLGAIIGSTVGGLAVGLYSKFVVPKSKSSLVKIINELEHRIMPDGLIVFDDKVIKSMKINKKHFNLTKPEVFNDSEWLTIVTVYLVNEIYYLFNLKNEEQITIMEEKLQQKPDDKALKKQMRELVDQFESIESMSINWERCRYFIQHQKINTLENSKAIGTFVNGMMANFKI